MRLRYWAVLLTLPLLLVGLWLVAAGTANAGAQKATLCCVPPDDPLNPHELVVSEKALEAHLRNHPGDQVGPCPEGCVGDCDDGDFCTQDVCNSDGSCDNSQAVNCSDGDVCTIDACDPEDGCVNPPVPDANQVGCDDGNACSEGEVCVAGACTGTAIPGCCMSDADCPASNACTTRYCEDATSTCQQVDRSTLCPAGACEMAFCDPVDGCVTTPVTCSDDGDICTVASCNPNICGAAGGCETIPNPNPPEEGPAGTCDDEVDNDCDGHVDDFDPDCEDGACNEDDQLIFEGNDYAGTGPHDPANPLAFRSCYDELLISPDQACRHWATRICEPIVSTDECGACLEAGNTCIVCKTSLAYWADFLYCEFNFNDCL